MWVCVLSDGIVTSKLAPFIWRAAHWSALICSVTLSVGLTSRLIIAVWCLACLKRGSRLVNLHHVCWLERLKTSWYKSRWSNGSSPCGPHILLVYFQPWISPLVSTATSNSLPTTLNWIWRFLSPHLFSASFCSHLEKSAHSKCSRELSSYFLLLLSHSSNCKSGQRHIKQPLCLPWWQGCADSQCF